MANVGTPPKSLTPVELLTPDEVGGLLRIDGATVRRKCACGQWPAVRVGRGYRLSRAWVETLLAPLALTLSAPAV